jgi:hypothetical protein
VAVDAKRSPEALYCWTTASKRGISPGSAPMPMPNAETDPSACAGAAANATSAQRNASAPDAAINRRYICTEPSFDVREVGAFEDAAPAPAPTHETEDDCRDFRGSPEARAA